ncbi:hypothetical protein GCM10025771_27740 [Niveibacterium umoris]|uniref:YtkA-like domain-containing protein n=1 Tax=Niveibacterium umoris TaxID=1193620 RepID=A0A840BHA5_9RHOO|nr:FixH family protein [Niveibacterium umoris]MBB4012033.1 hypothetical protein [Niveibacterium umoris]
MRPKSLLLLSFTRPPADSKFVVTLHPPATPIAIDQAHTWQVRLASQDGAPIKHARINVDGGMPQHGYGLLTRPRVTQGVTDGTYVIEGMTFSTTGWLEIQLTIESPQGRERVFFDVAVSEYGASH